MARGVFITLEGIDGCGKSTQARNLSRLLVEKGFAVVSLREPGGTPISEKVRGLLLDPGNAEMAPECELMLYEAARAQLVREKIQPALESGCVVVCDRFFDSTYAYQCAARGIDEKTVRCANALGSCSVTPDVTLLFDIDPECAFTRAVARGADRLEAEGIGFQRRVREGFLRLAAEEPGRVKVIDADADRDEVFSRVVCALEESGVLGVSLR